MFYSACLLSVMSDRIYIHRRIAISTANIARLSMSATKSLTYNIVYIINFIFSFCFVLNAHANDAHGRCSQLCAKFSRSLAPTLVCIHI